jgi:hypothetical protein
MPKSRQNLPHPVRAIQGAIRCVVSLGVCRPATSSAKALPRCTNACASHRKRGQRTAALNKSSAAIAASIMTLPLVVLGMRSRRTFQRPARPLRMLVRLVTDTSVRFSAFAITALSFPSAFMERNR